VKVEDVNRSVVRYVDEDVEDRPFPADLDRVLLLRPRRDSPVENRADVGVVDLACFVNPVTGEDDEVPLVVRNALRHPCTRDEEPLVLRARDDSLQREQIALRGRLRVAGELLAVNLLQAKDVRPGADHHAS
jgi:hypothetical protein